MSTVRSFIVVRSTTRQNTDLSRCVTTMMATTTKKNIGTSNEPSDGLPHKGSMAARAEGRRRAQEAKKQENRRGSFHGRLRTAILDANTDCATSYPQSMGGMMLMAQVACVELSHATWILPICVSSPLLGALAGRPMRIIQKIPLRQSDALRFLGQSERRVAKMRTTASARRTNGKTETTTAHRQQHCFSP